MSSGNSSKIGSTAVFARFTLSHHSANPPETGLSNPSFRLRKALDTPQMGASGFRSRSDSLNGSLTLSLLSFMQPIFNKNYSIFDALTNK
jgi:hypothetical protein